MILRAYQREDSPVIAKWLRTETELYQWSADRYGFFPLLPYSIDDNYAPQMKTGRFIPLTGIDEDGFAAKDTAESSSPSQLILCAIICPRQELTWVFFSTIRRPQNAMNPWDLSVTACTRSTRLSAPGIVLTSNFIFKDSRADRNQHYGS